LKRSVEEVQRVQSRAAEHTRFLLCSSLRHRVSNQVKELAADWPIAIFCLLEATGAFRPAGIKPTDEGEKASAPQQPLLKAVASLLHRFVLAYLETGLQALAIAVLASAAFFSIARDEACTCSTRASVCAGSLPCAR